MRFLLTLILISLPVAAEPVGAKEWKRIRRALPKHLWSKGAKWNREWDDATLTKRQFAELARILRAGSPYTTEKKRERTFDVPTGQGDATLPVLVRVPTKYKPGRGGSFPLIITFHGGPAGDLRTAKKGSRQQFKAWKGFVGTHDCIVAAPALVGGKYGDREWTYLHNVITTLDATYNVDRDRVLMTGHSWGGILTWHIGPARADTFALLAPFVCAINPGENHLKNCRALPIYHVQGKRDMKWMLDTGRERARVLDALEYEHTYRELPGGHAAFPGEIATIAKLFAKTSRNLYAPHLVRRPARGGGTPSDTWYWVRTKDGNYDAHYDAKARVIDTDFRGEFEVFVSDEMFDLDKPFTIRVDGEEVWRGSVKRRLGFVLEHIRETGDRGRIFAAKVTISDD